MPEARKRNSPKPLTVRRLPVAFTSDIRRVITRFFYPGSEARIQNVVQRVAQLSDTEATRLLELVFQRFRTRHSNIALVFEQHYHNAMSMVGASDDLARNRRLLIGSYFTMEYSVESAALFNPSIVEHQDQRNLPEGAVRFIMSLRATGEAHVSSIVFRTGVIYSDHEIQIDLPSRFANPIGVFPDKRYDKQLFHRKLQDIGVDETAVDLVLERLDDSFTMAQLEDAISAAREAAPDKLQSEDALQGIRWLARSNYELRLSREAEASEVVIFPQTSNESRGIEDLRMVRFVDDDGTATYYGTCTAFDGYRILPQLIETSDFLKIGVHTLNGARAQDKGMALFPRRIGGHYVMCSRIDGENLYIMYSDIIHFWETAELLQTPKHPWEFVQIGNCGSPLETPEGWLLLTHGVGPMRTYCIGAMLLDLDDPLKVIGFLDEPLITPTEKERDGYVPNVVYTCGAMIHNGLVYIPFGTSDTATRFATVSLDRLLDRLVN
ncbi:MAG TPA: glycoside hydrolase family 130 protein [Thermoguttaceae bacterium]|nr:glycoside hydrolase family 130 protein [Thermoguttaceae bacterium]